MIGHAVRGVQWRRAAWLVLGLSALSGCDTIGLALGTRMRLSNVPVRALSLHLAPQPAMSPGALAQLVITATTADGAELVTVGTEGGKVLFDSFEIDAQVVSVGPRGEVQLPADPRLSLGQVPQVRVRVVGQPDVNAQLDIPVRHDVRYLAHFVGQAGRRGAAGADGAEGANGAAGSSDSRDTSPGGRGANGDSGADGENGGDGEEGPPLQAWVTMAGSEPPMLQVRVLINQARELFYQVDPKGGSLSLRSEGGLGGAGGPGGRGGPGGQGGDGFPRGTSGFTGSDGSSGRSGRDGGPGRIIVRVDPRALPYLDRVDIAGPGPQVIVEPVVPWW